MPRSIPTGPNCCAFTIGAVYAVTAVSFPSSLRFIQPRPFLSPEPGILLMTMLISAHARSWLRDRRGGAYHAAEALSVFLGDQFLSRAHGLAIIA